MMRLKTVAGVLGVMVAGGVAIACEKAQRATAPAAAANSGTTDVTGAQDGAGNEIYMADLQPLNPHVGYRPVKGQARFQIVDGEFVAMQNATGAQPGMIHPQHIHAAQACPPPSADVNGDGFVDVIEGVPFYGPILVPLDSDLTTQAAGAFPFVHNHGGALQYHQRTGLNGMLSDLNAPDPDPGDAVVKLGGDPLDLPGRHVVLHGVALDTPLPATVASLGNLPAQLTLPIACGEISRVNR